MIGKLIENRFLALPNFDQSPPTADPTFPAGFVRALGRNYNIEESTTSGLLFNRTTISHVSVGSHTTKEHRTFRWLPWVLGKVSCVPLTGTDILTGTMSGCWLVIFSYHGVKYAGHIGTDTSPDTPATLQAKAAWRNAVNNHQIIPVKAFNPVGQNLPAFSALNLKGESPAFYGAFTDIEKVYTVVLTSGPVSGMKKRIAKLIQMPTTQDVIAF